MDLFVERVDVWAATIEDKPGGLADVLAVLRDAGANLQSVIARRARDQPGKGVLFVTPLQGDREGAGRRHFRTLRASKEGGLAFFPEVLSPKCFRYELHQFGIHRAAR